MDRSNARFEHYRTLGEKIIDLVGRDYCSVDSGEALGSAVVLALIAASRPGGLNMFSVLRGIGLGLREDTDEARSATSVETMRAVILEEIEGGLLKGRHQRELV